MPRYFFHTADGTRHRDTHGLELNNIGTARKEAIRFAGNILNDDPEVLWDGHEFRVEVTDSSDKLVLTVVMMAINADALH